MPYEETPKVQMERDVCITGMIAAVGGVICAAAPLFQLSGGVHTWRFLASALFLAAGAYLGWAVHALLNLRYTLDSDLLVASAGRRRTPVPLNQTLALHRWRTRWMWSGVLAAELGVAEVAFYPSVWMEGTTWVLVYTGEDGQRRGLVFRPSAQLLGIVRNSLLERRAAV